MTRHLSSQLLRPLFHAAGGWSHMLETVALDPFRGLASPAPNFSAPRLQLTRTRG